MDKTLSQVRATMEAHWSTMDADGDGVLEADDLLATMDRNHDGVLDKEELETLAKQLQEQSDYTSYLLVQLHKQEEQQLALQTEAAEKQATLRATLTQLERARNEAADMARKLEISEEVMNNMNEQCQKARIDAARYKREAEAIRKESSEAVGTIEQLRAERSQLHERVNDLARELGMHKKEAASQAGSDKERLAGLQRDFEDSQEKLHAAREELNKLKVEAESGRTAVLRLSEEAEEAKREATSVTQELKELRTQLADALRDKVETDRAVIRFKTMLQEEKSKNELQAHENEVLQQQIGSLNVEINALKAQLKELKVAKQIAEADREAKNAELMEVGKDFLKYKAARQGEKEAFEHRAAQLQADTMRIVAEARDREIALKEKLAEQASVLREETARHQEQFNKLQAELSEQHGMVRKLQQENAQAVEEFAALRKAQEAKAAQLQHRLDETVDSSSKTEQATKEQIIALATKLVEVRRDSIALAEKHVSTLGALQLALQQLSRDCSKSRDECNTTSNNLRTLQRAVLAIAAQQQGPMEDWCSEVKRGYLFLEDMMKKSKGHVEDVLDEAQQSKVQYEEERSKTLMLEEQVSSLEHELSLVQRRLLDAEAAAASHTRLVSMETDSRDALIKELQQNLDRTKEQLAEANRTSRELQQAATETQGKLVAAQQSSAVSTRTSDEQLAAARSEIRALQARCDAMEGEKRSLSERIADLERANGKVTSESKADVAAKTKELAELRRETEKLKSQISVLGTTLKKAQEQVQQSQSIISVVQNQKQQLQADNRQMRVELDEIYAARAKGTPSLPSPAVESTPAGGFASP